MQTFLPDPSFEASARCLDYRRLGKQRVEAKQLLLALGVHIGEHSPKGGWSNHPAARMWRGHEPALVRYGIAICEEWRRRGFKDTLLPQFQDADLAMWILPPWLGDKAFHRSHQSNLIRKDPGYYQKLWPKVPSDLPYIWPV